MIPSPFLLGLATTLKKSFCPNLFLPEKSLNLFELRPKYSTYACTIYVQTYLTLEFINKKRKTPFMFT